MVRQKGRKVRKRKQTQLIVNKKGKQSADQVPKKYLLFQNNQTLEI